MLTAERLKQALSYDPETGIFTWIVSPSNRVRIGMPAGAVNKSGINISIDGKLHKAHRLAWFYHNGVWPSGVIDHANADPLDNRIENLRDTNQTMNNANQRIRVDNTSGFKGVSWNSTRGKWQAYIKKDRKRTSLGYHASPELAHQAYCEAASREFGEYARSA